MGVGIIVVLINSNQKHKIMKQLRLITLGIAASLMFAACNNSGKSSVDNADSANEAKIDSGALSLNSDETEFMVQAANGGMTEVEMGKIAEKKARNKRVQAFGEMMVQDHTSANNQLKTIALNQNVTLPDSLSENSEDDVQKMSRKQGNDFDKDFMHQMVQDHEKTVKDFKDALDDVHNTILRQWISNTIPTLEKHLDSARAINDMLDGSNK